MTQHPTESTLASFLDGALDPAERARLVEHLDQCAQCRFEIGLASEVLLEGKARPRRLRWMLPAAAAAALGALLLLPPGQTSVERSTRPEGTPTFEIVAPTDGLASPEAPPIFVWRAAAPEASYELMLTDARGDVLWSERTADTMLVLPADVDLPAGEYYWIVDALLDRAREATTGVHRFTVDD